jgi:molybdenum cofactor biosynthesis enzyme MoaA
MNAQIQAIRDALTIDMDGTSDQLHHLLVTRSQKLRQIIDKITSAVNGRESKYTRIRELREEMDAAMHAMGTDGPTSEHRPITKIAADLRRVNDSIDKDIEKVYDLISEADALRSEVFEITQKIAEVPLATTAA